MESGVVPYPRVVAGSSVKNATLTLCAHPRPRLGLGMRVAFHRIAHHEDRTVLRIMVGMKVRLIPRLKCFNVLHCRMFGVGYSCAENGSLMTFESSTHQLVELRFIAETPAGAVHRHKPTAVLHKTLQILPLVRLNGAVIGVEQQHIKLAEILCVPKCFFYACGVIEINRIPSQRLGDQRVVLVGRMMFRVVAEKQHANGAIICMREYQAQQKQDRNKESGFHFGCNNLR